MSAHGPISARAPRLSALRKRLRTRFRSLFRPERTGKRYAPGEGPRRRVYVGTHHKSGTVWLRRIFHQIARQEGFWMNYTQAQRGQTRESMMIRFSGRSFIPPGMRDDPTVRMLHLIRDPRDMLISATHYHLAATEPFLSEPVEAFGGLTYQQRLLREPDLESRLLFEMRHHHAETLADMLGWPYGRPNAYEARYEDLIADREMRVFSEIFEFLGFSAEEIERARKIVWSNSLFGSLKSDRVQPHDTPHIRSGQPGQWRAVFSPKLAEAYAAMHGGALARLGYADSDQWVAEIAAPGANAGAAS